MNWRLRADDLVVIYEAGTAEVGDLLAIWRRCVATGAKLLLLGDRGNCPRSGREVLSARMGQGVDHGRRGEQHVEPSQRERAVDVEDACIGQHRVEGGCKLTGPIADEEPKPGGTEVARRRRSSRRRLPAARHRPPRTLRRAAAPFRPQ
jgi:hypothetical protein